MFRYSHMFPAIVGVLLAAMQISIIQHFSFTPIFFAPFIYVNALITSEKRVDALVAAIAAGITLDTFSPLPFGSHTLVLLGTAGLSFLIIRTLLSQKSTLSLIGLLVIIAALYTFSLHLVDYISYILAQKNNGTFFSSQIFTWILFSSIANTVLILILQRFLTKPKSFNIKPYIVR